MTWSIYSSIIIITIGEEFHVCCDSGALITSSWVLDLTMLVLAKFKY